jgi:hypothetical protein
MPADQLEFDLVHPSFASDAAIRELQREAKVLHDQAQERELAAHVEARLLFENSIIPTPASDLLELRSLVGVRDWQKNKNRYTRQARKNPRRFRRALVTLKKLLTHTT